MVLETDLAKYIYSHLLKVIHKSAVELSMYPITRLKRIYFMIYFHLSLEIQILITNCSADFCGKINIQSQ